MVLESSGNLGLLTLGLLCWGKTTAGADGKSLEISGNVPLSERPGMRLSHSFCVGRLGTAPSLQELQGEPGDTAPDNGIVPIPIRQQILQDLRSFQIPFPRMSSLSRISRY